MSYKYTFKQYLKEKAEELWEFLTSEVASSTSFVVGTLGALIIDILIWRKIKDLELLIFIIFMSDVMWVMLSILIGLAVGNIVVDFEYRKITMEMEHAIKEEQCQAEDHQ